jgi:hypothetical protein
VAEGSHEELLTSSELYREIVSQTSSGAAAAATNGHGAPAQVLAANGTQLNRGGQL